MTIPKLAFVAITLPLILISAFTDTEIKKLQWEFSKNDSVYLESLVVTERIADDFAIQGWLAEGIVTQVTCTPSTILQKAIMDLNIFQSHKLTPIKHTTCSYLA